MLQRTVSRLSSVKSNNEVDKNMTKLEQEFEVLEHLGEGGFGQIIKVKRKSDLNKFAIKIIKFDSNVESIETIKREAIYLSKLSHNNIVRYYNSWIEEAEIPVSEYEKLNGSSNGDLVEEIKNLSSNRFLNLQNECDDDDFQYGFGNSDEEEDDNDSCVTFKSDCKQIQYLFIQMELCDKLNLRIAIDNNLYLDEEKLSKYFKQICEGLSYIHEKGIVHRDLKPENIFLTSDDVIKIGDFGLSKQIVLEHDFETFQHGDLPYGSLTAMCGTHVYIAPELKTRNKFNIKADIYSLGVIFFEMCSKPMTEMEKFSIFPITLSKWNNINFQLKNQNKKNLLKTLLSANPQERPICKQILKILNCDKSFDEIREVIQQKRKVTNQERKNFEKTMKSINIEEEKLKQFFFTLTVKIFEAHGGQNITMPTFIPSFGHHSDNLTALLNTQGNPISLSRTSRIAFAYYVAKNKINKIRRYSTGKIYEEGSYSPIESKECLFQAISPDSDDDVQDAEMMFIAKEVYSKAVPIDKNITFIINHTAIFFSILKYCRISKEDTRTIINIVKNASASTELLKKMIKFSDNLRINIVENVYTSIEFLKKIIDVLNLNRKIKTILAASAGLYSVDEAEKAVNVNYLKMKDEGFEEINLEIIDAAFSYLRKVVKNAEAFGVTNVLVMPLFINYEHSSGFMFTMFHDSVALANGGRFDSLIKKCSRLKKKRSMDISAVEVSFHVKNFLQVISPVSANTKEVAIFTAEKSLAIPVYSLLISNNIKCEIVTDPLNLNYPIIVEIFPKNACKVYRRTSRPWSINIIVFSGNWKKDENDFVELISTELQTGTNTSRHGLGQVDAADLARPIGRGRRAAGTTGLRNIWTQAQLDAKK